MIVTDLTSWYGVGDTSIDDTIVVDIDAGGTGSSAPEFRSASPASYLFGPGDVNVGTPLIATGDGCDDLGFSLAGDDGRLFDVVDISTITEQKTQIIPQIGTSYMGGNSYRLIAEATDYDTDPAEFNVEILFQDSRWTFLPVNLSLPEDASPGDIAGTVEVEGADDVVFSLTDDAGGLFDIGLSDGQVSLASGKALNAEQQASYTITVPVADSSGDSASTNLTVAVIDVLEKPGAPSRVLVISLGPSSLNVSWNPPETNPGPEIEDYDVEYRVGSSGPDTDVGYEGAGTFTTIAALAPGTTYEVHVQAWNQEMWSDWSLPGSGAADSSSGAEGADGADSYSNQAPQFPASVGLLSVPANSAGGTLVGTVTADDPDSDTLMYSLLDDGQGTFVVDATQGKILVASTSSLDSETQGQYFVTLQASDGQGETDSVRITINVIDVTETPDRPEAPTVSSTSNGWTHALRAASNGYTHRPNSGANSGVANGYTFTPTGGRWTIDTVPHSWPGADLRSCRNRRPRRLESALAPAANFARTAGLGSIQVLPSPTPETAIRVVGQLLDG